MNFECFRSVLYGFLFWLDMAIIIAGVSLRIFPSNIVNVNDRVTLWCEIEREEQVPPSAIFLVQSPYEVICALEPSNGVCKKTTDPCQSQYNPSCPNDTVYSIQVTVSRNWNGLPLVCEDFNGAESKSVMISVRAPVTSVTLTPNPITANAGQLMNLTCATSYSNPPANITWIKNSVDISSQSNLIYDSNGSSISTIQSRALKEDNGKKVYCTANNSMDRAVSSEVETLNILYEPEVSLNSSGPYMVDEGNTAKLICTVTDANPITGITWRWIKTDSPSAVLHNGPNYTIPDIQRGRSGQYSCTASNSIGTSKAATIDVDVQYKPEVSSNLSSPYSVTEGQTATLMCRVIDANPNTDITWRWIKIGSTNVVPQNGPTYIISYIQRGSSGQYNCTASNSIGTSNAATIDVDVQYKPDVSSNLSSPYNVTEGQTATLMCTVIDANPNTGITWRWIKIDSTNFVPYNGPTYTISNIKRGESGQYSCTARNSIGTSEAATIDVNVQYKPSIKEKEMVIVNETDRVELIRKISSNPLPQVSWFNGTELLESETSITSKTSVTTMFTIQNARCTDTNNFTVVASNELQRNVTSRVELRVNCKPMPDIRNITLGVSDDTGFAFSTTVIAYPQPRYIVFFGNSTNNNGVWDNMTMNAINNFTVHLNKTTVKQADYGTYHLNITNSFGGSTIYVNVVPEREPTSPRIGKASCNVNSAKIEWISSFDGGDSVTFFALGLIGQHEVTRSGDIEDRGENKIHNTELLNLQPSTKYVFYVVATNKHGNSSSNQIECTTLEDAQNTMPLIIGSATAGGMFLAVVLIVVVVLLRRYNKHEKQVGKSQRFDNDEGGSEGIDDDGLKENILYVSAGPRNNNESERAVYAAVTKKNLEDNANVYADVKKDGKKAKTEAAIYSDVKPKKGLFKKDGKQKPKNGKKQRGKEVAADVYENSEDIAMTSNADNVYSNTNYNAKNNQEQRGYKNKDGLLYVDVQFDAKKGKENPVIHGEDEKTDYATVEFPMPPLSQEDASAEKY